MTAFVICVGSSLLSKTADVTNTIDMGKADSTKQSDITVNSEQSSTSEHLVEQTSIDPKSESQFSSFMSYHEDESSSLDPSTMEQELSKSPIEESTQKNDSGTNDQVDISSHDEDIIAYETKESSSPSVEISSSTTSVTGNEKVAEVNEPESTIEVEVMEPRRSGRDRKQTKFFGNPLLYRVTWLHQGLYLSCFSICLKLWRLCKIGTVKF